MSDTREQFKELIEEQRVQTFMPEYRAEQPETRIAGIVLSQYFHWNGCSILEAAISGLEDANFHTEARRVEEILEKVKAEFATV